ncbi:Gfo/Idh/MocA family oxidoreductase [Aquibacillus sp. 3ASR75-11]|uniref:Gfo/Idh/MocA family oxidoreductase n=1 Tax=Terrihalobacillus insolitus TaxID=2950438 RepID=A0A9X4AM97_9BACI|nr:Gfo/Idh/MocA family oxidoreductase [Terrihalobacillus insolitus]MDC3412042.1 Gfo/Idh/MocA family oxidoreductase [Terrihalobacillus insolitus]MDC3423265.1 Gfo/Idh/MocA family oxidoreductase [Terrihalobacillus insolitus]
MTKLKIGVIGCGSIATHRHLPEYAQNKEVEIVAVCDVVEKRAQAAATTFGGTAYTDYKQLLADSDADAVSVCLPNYLHAPVSIAALEAGKHVLCEKPMATSREEADQMIQAAEKAGKKLMIGHNQRFVASHQKAKELIANGELGRIYSFRTAFGHGGPEGWSVDGASSWFFKKDEAFIGALGDLGVHKADLIRYILGEEVKEVSAFVESNAKQNSNVDDNAVCLLRTESGIIGTLVASWAYVSAEDNSTVIYGEKGVLRLVDDPTYSLIAQYKDGSTVNYELGQIQSNDEGGQSNTGVIDHFVESILNNEVPLIDGKQGKRSLEVILAALESHQEKKNIQL